MVATKMNNKIFFMTYTFFYSSHSKLVLVLGVDLAVHVCENSSFHYWQRADIRRGVVLGKTVISLVQRCVRLYLGCDGVQHGIGEQIVSLRSQAAVYGNRNRISSSNGQGAFAGPGRKGGSVDLPAAFTGAECGACIFAVQSMWRNATLSTLPGSTWGYCCGPCLALARPRAGPMPMLR